MTAATLLALLGIVVVTAYTPGPNNILAAQSGAQFGFRRTLPQLAGVVVGYPLMMLCISLGLGAVFQQSELLRQGVSMVGMAVLLWLAWKTATSGKPGSEKSKGRPRTFLEMVAFQWVNPKSWVICISITSQFVDPANPILTSAIITSIVMLNAVGSGLVWCTFGTVMQRWLTTDLRANLFNYASAALLLISVGAIAFA